MKLFLIFYGVTGLMFILALCRAASRRNAASESMQIVSVNLPVQVDFSPEESYSLNITTLPIHDNGQDNRKCA